MAKDIKVVKCPQCGSIDKTEIKPDFFKCDNCGATYYLDNDDININVNYKNSPELAPSPTIPVNKKGVAALVAVLAFGFVMLLAWSFLFPKTSAETKTEPEPYRFYENYVYLNPKSQQPFLIRVGHEYLRSEDSNADLVNIRAVFIDPVTKARIADQLLLPNIRRLDNNNYDFKSFSNGVIYMIYNKSKLFRIDPVNHKFKDVTATEFSAFPELSSGIGTIEFSRRDIFNIRSNDGNRMYYVVAANKMFPESAYSEMDKFWEAGYNTEYFSEKNDQLMKLDSKTATYKDLSPGRKYFEMKIVYQDSNDLLISSNVNAGVNSDVILQRIDANTGQVKWTYPAAHFYFGSSVKYKSGYAIEYASGDNMEYISGVLMISDTGKLLHDYQIKRGD